MSNASNMDPTGPVSERVRARRRAARASYGIESVREVFDEALLCHVAFVDDGHPYVLPTMHVRRDDVLYIHGGKTNRMLRIAGSGAPITVEATIVDSLVMGRSVFQNSVNYRSAVVLGTGHEVTDRLEKVELMNALIERLTPGRLEHLRPLEDTEIEITKVIAIPITEHSAKARTGPPVDKKSDYSLPVWAGELPLGIKPGVPIPDPHVVPHILPLEHVLAWGEGRRGV